MRKVAKYMVVVCVLALFGALLAGCSGQASSGSASSSASAQSTEGLLAELQGLNNDYKSVTMDMKGNVTIDYAAMLSSDDSSESAAASDASAAASDASASAEASDASASSDSSTAMDIPLDINAKCDLSGDVVKMYMVMDMMGQNIEMYINGNDAVMVMAGQAIGATLDELNMSQYASIDSIMQSQGANIDQYKDAIQSIEKTTEGNETVYKVVCDASKISTSDTSSTLSQLGGAGSLNTLNLTYRVNADGQLSGFDINMAGKGFSSDMTATLYDYNTTTVPDAPEPTVKYSDILGGNANSASAAAEESSSASAEAKAA